ncbi:MAG: GxxExxY protein [Anaerolineales bacterium]|nr:GxxExxY protein [Anaerolineales bacterium]MCA9929977.1 GxxExxY protein [Anaerolineales bacterium]
MSLLHEKESYQLRGCVYEVRKKLKTGWSEEAYHQALVKSLEEKGVPFVSKPRCPMFHRGVEVHIFEPDLIIWDQIILELKVLPYARKFAPGHYTQLINYLKFFGKNLGFLVNFGPTKAKIERVIWYESELEVKEDYEAIQNVVTGFDRDVLNQVRKITIGVGNQLGLGYPATVYREVFNVELKKQKIDCTPNFQVYSEWNGQALAKYTTDHLLVAEKFLINIQSLLTYPPLYDFARMKTYLTRSGLQLGLIANFGKKDLQIYGINGK